MTLLAMIPQYKIPPLKVTVKNPVLEILAHRRIVLTVLLKIMMFETPQGWVQRGLRAHKTLQCV